MTTWIYGACHIYEASSSTREALIDYWELLSKAHTVEIGLDHPYLEDIDSDIAGLWNGTNWLKFYLKGDFCVAAARHAAEIFKDKQKGLTALTVWPRVSEWRFLGMMLSHDYITDFYFLVEDASGDIASAEQVKDRPLPQMLDELWLQYVYLSSEDAVLYHVDYSKHPL